MAEPKKYETKAGTWWRIQYRGPDRKPTTKGSFLTKKAANDWYHDHMVAAAAGDVVTPAAGKITVNKLGEKFLAEEVGVTDTTLRAYRQALDRIRRTGKIGETWVKDLRQAGVREWVALADTKFAAKTVGNDLSVLHQVLEQAVTDRRIRQNPAAKVKAPKGEEKEILPITASQLASMAEAAGDYYGVAILTLGLCGLRWGELVGLQAGDVNLDAGHIYIIRQKKEVDGTLVDGPPKYDKPRFTALPEPVATLLAERLNGLSDTDLVFPTPTGSPMWVGNARRDWFDPAAREVG